MYFISIALIFCFESSDFGFGLTKILLIAVPTPALPVGFGDLARASHTLLGRLASIQLCDLQKKVVLDEQEEPPGWLWRWRCIWGSASSFGGSSGLGLSVSFVFWGYSGFALIFFIAYTYIAGDCNDQPSGSVKSRGPNGRQTEHQTHMGRGVP